MAARTTFLPAALETQFSKDVATFFIRKAIKENSNKGLQMFCIDKALSFATDAEHLSNFAEVIQTNKLKFDGQEIDVSLTPDHKYQFIKAYYGHKDFTIEQKEALKTLIFENDTSDKGAQVKALCDYSLPDPELKMKLWNDLTSLTSEDSVNTF